MSHHQIPRLDCDQAERCDGTLPFASRLMALLSMTVHWTGQAFVGGKTPFSAVAQMVGFGLGRSKMLYLSMGLTDSLSATLRHNSPQYPIIRIYRRTTEEFRDVALILRASCSFPPWVRRMVLPPLHCSLLYPIVRSDSKNNE
jgi:hypothetical protein